MFRFLLNLLLPQPPHVAALENMSAAEFHTAVPPLPAPPREWALALFPYANPLVKTAVWEVKYRGNSAIARLMGELLADELAAWLAELAETENFREPLLVPIPLSPRRLRERGFNQCELLARAMFPTLEHMAEVNTRALVKIKETESQTRSGDREARLKNLAGCFAVKSPAAIQNRNVVLLDDVTTTGATLLEARRALLAAGARRVIALTFAH